MPEKSSNLPSSTVYSAIVAELLRIARASNNTEPFSTAFKPLIDLMNSQLVSIYKINGVLNFLNKHQGDFSNVHQSKQELPHLVS